ncbi:PH, RCC1 and FYVE domains-containing protein 1-like [Lycium ferocissimum]|uniref:PH, RCC1 and FYVE domains-containing protein 1-like n=1 Tax=Lycium ferocissimum TaxID=112874 RepID=UPI002814F0B3|nr:PH, RCC1 and FYVE domains-containing protein 1-like [Lycium ferocissimum]
MGDEHLFIVTSDRAVEQAIIALKKGAHLLKYGRRGKPRFCPLRLSTDEKFLIWYSGEKENQLSLSAVTDIIRGAIGLISTTEMDSQCISLIYGNSNHTLDLICKDRMQAATWFLGLRAVISRSRHGLVENMKSKRGVQSCISSPVGYMRRKHNLGLSVKKSRISQVRSLSGSPAQSFSEKWSCDGLSRPYDIFLPQSSLSSVHDGMDNVITNSSSLEPKYLSQKRALCDGIIQNDMFTPSLSSTHKSRLLGKYVLRDVFIWGEGGEGGYLGYGEVKVDALLPKLLESTTMLDVQTISIGRSHAALVTKQGEVFCWGEGKNGRLGHKLVMDTPRPKIVDSLNRVHVKSVSCGEYHTCALTTSGELYTWGDNFGAETKMRSYNWLPNRVCGSLDGVKISYVACGEWHTGIVSTSGQLFTYGNGTFGVLGHGNLQSVAHPKEVESLRGLRVKSVACGPWHMAALVEISTHHLKFNNLGVKLFIWGDGDYGKLGSSDNERKLLPTCVAKLVDHDFIQVACANTLTIALSRTGEVYTMGSSKHGQLGNPQAKGESVVAVQGKLKDEFVTWISSGSYHVAVLTSKGNVYTWGKGSNGQLGLGDTEERDCPTLVEALRDRQVEQIVCGSNSTAAICLHKSISSTDQSVCRGCGMAFGIRRKKQNCYNCGLLFCRACCNKKTTNASLGLDKTKAFWVCDPCFCQLQRLAQSSRQEKHSPRPLLITQKEEGEESNSISSRMMSTRRYSSDNSQCYNVEESKHWLDLIESLLDGFPRWGQVPCPEFLRRGRGHHTRTQNSKALAYPTHLKVPPEPKVVSSSALIMQEKLSESNKFLLEEVSRLRTQLQTMSESLYFARRETKNEAVEDRKVDSLLASPIVFSKNKRSLYNKKQNYADDLEVEWVEECQPGVLITFTISPTGNKKIKRVKFSWQEFTKKEANKWWEENQLWVYRKYDVEGYTNMSQDITKI